MYEGVIDDTRRGVVDLLETLRSQLLDLMNGWPVHELCESPDVTIKKIDALIGPRGCL